MFIVFLMHILKWARKNIELLFWLTALILLFFLDTGKPQASFCFFSWIGFNECPGCGLGHSIHYTLHLDPVNAIHHHILGIPAVIIIFIRIKQLLYPKHHYETKSSQPDPRYRR
jgi:hypothetical protein